ncbi:hypothetical protein E4U17_001923 [Claviceps sp. LM77 group G4]|nr:hypothetical protein E4U17_001923 [Claviceps sp. LM77 group G4]
MTAKSDAKSDDPIYRRLYYRGRGLHQHRQRSSLLPCEPRSQILTHRLGIKVVFRAGSRRNEFRIMAPEC